MFQSSGFFKSVHCPFFKHDLCHRPYCHFKHIKGRLEKEKEKEAEEKPIAIENNRNAESSDDDSLTRSPTDGVNEEVLKIVQKISPSKLIEYAKRKQESEELQQKLAQVDKDLTHPSLTIPAGDFPEVNHIERAAVMRSPEEIRRGLVDSFYSKDKVEVNITSGNVDDKPRPTNDQTTNIVSKMMHQKRIVCNCDDPDCSGFQEENLDNSFSHIDINQIEDEYTRRKVQRKLDRRKRDLDLVNPTDIVINEADFFIPSSEVIPEPEPIDEDLNNYIDKVKEEYERKKKLEAEKNKKLNEKSETEKEKEQNEKNKLSNEVDKIANEKNKILNGNDKVQKEKKALTNDVDKVVNGKNIVSNEINKVPKEKKTSNITVEKDKVLESEKQKKGIEKKKKDEEKKKVLSDVDFFSAKVSQNNSEVLEDIDDDIKDDNTVSKKKSNILDEIASYSKDLNRVKKKSANSSTVEDSSLVKSSEKTGEVKKKRVFFPNESVNKTEKSDSDKKLEAKKKNDNKYEDKSEKKSKSSKTDEEKSSKKVKTPKEVSDKDDNSKSEKKSKTEQLSNQINDKLKKNGFEKKDKSISSKSDKNNSYKSNDSSSKLSSEKRKLSIDENSISEKKDKKIRIDSEIDPNDFDSMIGKRKQTDSESSDGSRTAFDVITLSSSDDEDTEKTYSSCEEVYDVDDFKYEKTSKVKEKVSLEEVFDVADFKYEKTSKAKEKVVKHKEERKSIKAGEPKKRIALTNEDIPRKPVQPHKSKSLRMSYVSPCLKSTKPPEEVHKPTPKTVAKEPTPSPSQLNDEFAYGTGKKRISHVRPKPVSNKPAELERPKLPVDIGGKIPHLLRQRYFDKLIDEFLPKVKTRKSAFDKAFQEEADAYKRCTRKQIYINLCANIVKRIRGMPDYVGPKEPPPRADPMKTGEPTTKSVKSKIDSLKSTRPPKVDLIGAIKKNISVSRIQSASTAGYKKVDPKSTIPKNCIKPASSELVKTAAEHQPAGVKRVRTASLTLEPMELTEDNFYEQMKQYLLTKEQLWDNKYPKRDPDNPKGTIIKDYVSNVNTLKRVCCRCGKEYFMNKKGKYVTRNECHYHWGKLLRQRGRNSNAQAYSCCGVDESGDTCALCRLHVCNKTGPLESYVSTEFCDNKDSRRKVFALDCEMCYTTQGLELTRLTVIDFDLEQIIDLFVKPTNPIVDYNTRFSGVTREDLADVTTTISDIHDILLNMIDKDTILMGHSLESDLNALNIIHEKAVDTAIVFPHRMGLPYKRALRNLMAEHLQKVIQSGEGGHDSCEDARSCMELMKYKFKEDQKSRKRSKT